MVTESLTVFKQEIYCQLNGLMFLQKHNSYYESDVLKVNLVQFFCLGHVYLFFSCLVMQHLKTYQIVFWIPDFPLTQTSVVYS